MVAGVIGKKRSIYHVWGEAVNLASRLAYSGQAGLIQISEATLAALGAQSGKVRPLHHAVKGIGEITSYFLG